jgi:hypothetical protein
VGVIVEVEEEASADRGEIKDRLTGKRSDNMCAWKRAVGDGQLLDPANFLIEIGKRHGIPPLSDHRRRFGNQEFLQQPLMPRPLRVPGPYWTRF